MEEGLVWYHNIKTNHWGRHGNLPSWLALRQRDKEKEEEEKGKGKSDFSSLFFDAATVAFGLAVTQQ